MHSRHLLRPTLRAVRSSSSSTTTTTTTTAKLGRRHGHGLHYDPPSGWLFGQDPATAPKGRESWENIMYYGFFGSFFVAGVAYAYKPDTNIETWALEEARRRLETEGAVPDSTTPVKITEQLKTVSGKDC
ncbi:ESSS subunit of NADH:ubiquinone oxidoreductase-domain-containing protein [Sphaerosporella brunnea]|uniref:NADH dehydrogenase [ubiquinone] 1 beta subcomplex subunit 11, mitochondrial n=1 Tax=Sphaerosporella brunnea TaxID=1250544 RepID=A0A5J5EVU7_9PEZI|nr:ESSS subunit of NADH:ubiquinone oxidoreductase-domain-containing protein [Sphaerosporella brunnea]